MKKEFDPKTLAPFAFLGLAFVAGLAAILFDTSKKEGHKKTMTKQEVKKEVKLSADPNSETNLFSKGQQLAHKGEYKQASEVYQSLLKKDPKHAMAWAFLSDCQLKLNRKADAITSLEKAYTLSKMPRHLRQLKRLYKQAGLTNKLEELEKGEVGNRN